MGALRKVSTLLFLLVWIPLSLLQGQPEESQSLPGKVVMALKKGNAAGLTPFLNERLELVIPGKSGVFSKEQAYFILKGFFEDHPVISFQILHHGARENSTFVIGRYNCRQGQYRLYFLIKNNPQEPGQIVIHQIRIEKQDD
jgi:hypothetical protein